MGVPSPPGQAHPRIVSHPDGPSGGEEGLWLCCLTAELLREILPGCSTISSDRLADFRRAVILSRDGLCIAASRDLSREDAEHLSAVAAAVQSLAAGTGDRFAAGGVRQTIIELEQGHLLPHRGRPGQLPGGAVPFRGRRGHRRLRDGDAGQAGQAAPRGAAAGAGRPSSRWSDRVPADDGWPQRESGPVVRPYAVTGGRTEPADGDALDAPHHARRHRAAAAGRRPRAAGPRAPPAAQPVQCGRSPWPTSPPTPRLPLGVVRVLVADLTELAAITVVGQRSADQKTGNDVLQEILNGLRAL